MSKCPNKSLQAWQDLSNKYGNDLAYKLYYENNNDIPNLDKAEELLGKKPELKTHLYLGKEKIDPATKKELLDGLELYFLNSYFKESDGDFDSLFNSRLNNVNEIFLDVIEETKAELFDQGNEKLAYAIDGYEDHLIDLLQERLSGYGLNIKTSKKKKDLEINEDGEPTTSYGEDPDASGEDKQSRDTLSVDHAIYYNTKTGFPKAVKLLINSIAARNSNGEVILSTIGLPTKANLESLLLNTLADVPWNINDQIKRLREIEEEYPFVSKLIEKLGGDVLNTSDISQIPYSKVKLRLEFSQAFGKHKYDLLIGLLTNKDFVITNANQESLEKQIETKWASNFNKLIESYRNKPDEFVKKLKETKSTKDLAALLGIEFINENILDTFSKDYVPGTNYNANEFVKSIAKGIVEDYETNKKNFEEGKTDTLVKLENLYQRSGNVSLAIGNITKLINHISKYEMPTDLQLINGEGKVVYSINLHTYQSLITTLLNYPNLEDKEIYLKDKLPHLFNVSNQNSIWLNDILNGSTINMVLIDALGGDTTETQHLSDIKENDMMSVVISSLLKDIYPAIKHSDRGMFPAYVINTETFSTKDVDALSQIIMEKNGMNWSGRGVEKFKDILVDYLWDEYNTAKLNTDLKVDHFDTNKNESYILNDISWSLKQYNDKFELKKDLNKDINTFVNNYFNETYSQFEEYGLLQPALKKAYVNGKFVKIPDESKPYIGISNDDLNKFKDILKTDELAKNAIIGVAAAKYFIGAVEQFKLFLGNSSYYAIKNEKELIKSTIFDVAKRSNMQSSSKNVTAVDAETNAWVAQNNQMDKIFDSKTGEFFVYKDGKADGTFTELVMADDTFISSLDNYFKLLYGENSPKYKAYKKFTENDGISLVNPFFNREFQHRRGDYNEAKNRTFLKELDIINKVFSSNIKEERDYELKQIHQITQEVLDMYTTNGVVDYDKIFLEYYSPFVVEKPQYVGPNYGMNIEEYKSIDPSERLGIVAGRKTSYMNLLPSMVIDTVLEDVLMFMLKNGIDTIHFNSAAKFGGLKESKKNEEGETIVDFRGFYNKVIDENGNKYTNGFNNSAIDPLSIGVLDFRFLGKQQEISGEMKEESTESTQKRKIIQSGIVNFYPIDVRGIISEEDWNKLSKQQKTEISPLFAQAQKDLTDYINSQNEIIKLKLENLLSEFGYTNNSITQPIAFINALIRQARDRNSADNIIQSLENWMTIGGGLKYIETLPNYNKIQNILSSILNNNVIREKRPGTAVPQIPSTGFEKRGIQRRIVDDKIESQNALGEDAAVNYYTFNEDGTVNPAEIMIPLPTYWIEPLFEHYRNKKEGVKKGDIQGLLDKVNRDLANGTLKNLATYTGLRIPNQQLSSTDVLTVKKFFHPSFQSGAVVPSELVVKTGGDFDIDKLNLYFLNLNNNFESVGGENYESVEDILNENTDNDVKIQKLQNFNLKKGQNLLLKYQPERFLSPVDDSSVKDLKDDTSLVSTSKKSRNHMYKINELPKQTTEFIGGKGGVGIIATWITFNNLAQVHNIQVLPEFINGFDKNNNPIYVSTKLHFPEIENYSLGNVSDNLNQQIEDVLSALLTSQVDIVKDTYASDLSISTNTLNTICYLVLRGVPIDNIIRFLKEPIITQYIKERNLNESQIYKHNGLRLSKDELTTKVSNQFNNNDYLLKRFLDYEESAKRVNEFKAYISADTKALKDLNEYDLIEELYKKVANLNNEGFSNNIQGLTNIIDPAYLRELKNNSVISSFIEARDYQNKLYSNLYLTRLGNIKKSLSNIKNMFTFGEKEKSKNGIRNKIDEEFINYLVQTKNDLFKDKYNSLITGENSLAKRLIDLKKNPKFKDNLLIQDLISNLDNNNQDKIKLFRIKLTTPEINQYSSFFDDLKQTDKNLYYDLLVTNIFISGMSPGPFQLSKIISYNASEEILNVLSKVSPNLITENDFKDFLSKLPIVRPDILPLSRDKYKKNKITFNLFRDYNFTDKKDTITITDLDKIEPPIKLNKNTNYRQELSREYLNFIDKFLKDTLNFNNIITTNDIIKSEKTDDTDVETEPTEKEIIPLKERFTRESVSKDSNYIYLFTDNAARTSGSGIIDQYSWYAKKYGKDKKYPTKTQAVIRGLNNAYPITTMVNDKRVQWTDNDFEEYKKIIDDEIFQIQSLLPLYDGIKFSSEMPFGKGEISDMKNTAPKIWNYLNQKLAEIGIDNTGNTLTTISQPTTPTQPQAVKAVDTETDNNIGNIKPC